MEGTYYVEVEVRDPHHPDAVKRFRKRIEIKPARRGVLYIPGIAGSHLEERKPNGTVERRWVPLAVTDNDLRALALDGTGTPNEVSVAGVVESLPLEIAQDYGLRMRLRLETWGYRSYQGGLPLPHGPGIVAPGTTLYQLGYDWRKSLADTADALDVAVDELRLTSGSRKIVLVAHSMGGLISRLYLVASPSHQQKTAQLVTIGTPLRGTPKAAKILYHGDGFLPWPLDFDPAVFRDVARTFPSVYSLLPSSSYFTQVDDEGNSTVRGYVRNWETDTWLGVAETETWLTQAPDNPDIRQMMSSLIRQARDFHDLMDGQPVGVPWTQIIGSGEPTLVGLSETASFKSFCDDPENCNPMWILEWGNGDGTVSLTGARDGGPNEVWYVSGNGHAELPGQVEVVDFLQQLLGYIDHPELGEPELAYTPATWNGTQYSFFSPVDVHVYDDAHKHAGSSTHPKVENDLSDVLYTRMGESQHVFIPDNGKKYRIEVKGTGRGLLDVHVVRYVNARPVTRDIYSKIEVTSKFKARFDVPSGRERHVLQVDTAGSGMHSVLDPSTTVTGKDLTDSKPPTTTVAVLGTLGLDGWYTSEVEVTISAVDSNSGVLSTMYLLNDDGGFVPYRHPIKIKQSGTTTIKAGSTDRAGNDEKAPVVVSVKIDREGPEISLGGLAGVSNRTLDGPISVRVDVVDAASGVKLDEYRIDDGPWNPYTLPIGLSQSGNHFLEVRAFDFAGNASLTTVGFKIR